MIAYLGLALLWFAVCLLGVLWWLVACHDEPEMHRGPVSRRVGVVDWDAERRERHRDLLLKRQ